MMDDIRSLAKNIASAEVEAPAEELLRRAVARVTTWAHPDRIEFRQSFSGGPKMVAIKRLPAPVKDAWGREVTEDAVVAADCNIICYGGEGEWLIERPSEEVLMQQTYPFLLLSDDEQQEVIAALSEFIYLDVDDLRGTRLGAVTPIGAREDSPVPEWNYYIRRLREAEEERSRKDSLKEFERLSAFHQIVDHGGTPAALVETKFGSFLVEDWAVDRFNWYLSALEKFYRDVDDYASGRKPIVGWKNRKLGISGEAPLEGNTLRVPPQLIGPVIGKGGENIKPWSRILNRRIKVEGIRGAEGAKLTYFIAAPPRKPELPNGVTPVNVL